MRSSGTAEFVRFFAAGEDHNRPLRAHRNTGFHPGPDAGRLNRSWSPGPVPLASNPIAIVLTQTVPREASTRQEVSNPA